MGLTGESASRICYSRSCIRLGGAVTAIDAADTERYYHPQVLDVSDVPDTQLGSPAELMCSYTTFLHLAA
jgi:hypothetical protein